MNNNEILNQFIQILLPILATFLTGIFTYIGTRLRKVYEDKVNNVTIKAIVQDAVKFVEQVYTDLDGKDKLQIATNQVTDILQSKGITITQAEIYMLIESAVYGLNEGWFDKKENQQLLKELQTLALDIQIKQSNDSKTTSELPDKQENYIDDDDLLDVL